MSNANDGSGCFPFPVFCLLFVVGMILGGMLLQHEDRYLNDTDLRALHALALRDLPSKSFSAETNRKLLDNCFVVYVTNDNDKISYLSITALGVSRLRGLSDIGQCPAPPFPANVPSK